MGVMFIIINFFKGRLLSVLTYIVIKHTLIICIKMTYIDFKSASFLDSYSVGFSEFQIYVPQIPEEFTSLVLSFPIELGSALINLTGMPSTLEAFLLSRPLIFDMTSDSEPSDR